MRTSALIAAAAGLLCSSAAIASDVLDLHKDDFHGIVQPEDLMLVEFFARKHDQLTVQCTLDANRLADMSCCAVCSLVSVCCPSHFHVPDSTSKETLGADRYASPLSWDQVWTLQGMHASHASEPSSIHAY